MKIQIRAWDEKNRSMAYSDSESLGDFMHCYSDQVLMLSTGIIDCEGIKIYADDLLKDAFGKIFRVYFIQGGFVIKDSVWQEDVKDFVATDSLISIPLSDAQTQNYISQSCIVIGNIHSGVHKY